MYNLLLTLLIIDCVLMVIVIMMQPSKTNSASSALSGGAEELFGKQKARGFEAVMQRSTVVMGIIFFGLSIALAYISSH